MFADIARFTNTSIVLVVVIVVVMAALHSRCGHHIFALWFQSSFLSFFFFSSPNLSGR